MSTPVPPASGDAPKELRGPDVARMFQEKHREAVADLGRFNLAVFGKTGAGKSTLINAIFGTEVAKTGTGAPVTEGLTYYEHPEGFLGIYDSQGFETGQAGDEVLSSLTEIVRNSQNSPGRQIHAAWYVIRWSDRRFEQGQAEFVRELETLIPVIMVMTMVPMNEHGQIHSEALELGEYIVGLGLPLSPTNMVVYTNAKEDSFLRTPVFGLQELVDATFATAPQAALRALTAAQLVDKERKKQQAREIIAAAATAAVATGVTPIPFADAAILVPIQIGMIAKITAAYGMTMPSNQLATLVGSLLLSSGATTAGRWLVGSLMKVIPGGQIPGLAISGAVAGALTTAMGWAWVAVCERGLAAGGLQNIRAEEIQDLFSTEFKRRFKFPGRGGSAE